MAADDQDTDGGRHPLAWLPNALTIARVAIAPIILVSLLSAAFSGPTSVYGRPILAAGLLLLAAALDWLDGRLARAWNAQSAFGRFWDPIADKLVVGAALVGGAFVLPTFAFIVPATALIVRDATITWLRTHPRYAAATAQPSRLAKWKTALEFAALVVLFSAWSLAGLAGGAEPQDAYAFELTRLIFSLGGLLALWLAAALSLWTGWAYVRIARRAVN